MGHRAYTRLPRRGPWKLIALLLDSPGLPVDVIAARIAFETRKLLDKDRFNTPLAHAFQILLTLVRTCRFSGLADAIKVSNLPDIAGSSLFSLSASIARQMRAKLSTDEYDHTLTEISVHAMQIALAREPGLRLPSLFNNDIRDMEQSLSYYAEPRHFASLSQQLFAAFLSGVTEYIASKHVPSQNSSVEVKSKIKDWSVQVAKVTAQYSNDWYATHLLHTKDLPTYQLTKNFTSYGISKLWNGLRLESSELENAQ